MSNATAATAAAAIPNPAPFEDTFSINVLLVVLTLFPGLINTSAVNFAASTVAHNLGAQTSDISILVLLNDAGLAFGCLLAAELTRRIANRSLYLTMLIVSAAASLLSCVAPNLAIFGVAHCLHGLVGGMLFVIALPPLFLNFAATRIRALVIVLVPSLFGAATLQAPNAWRALFALEIAIALIALVLTRKTVPFTRPPPIEEPVDWEALVLAGFGTTAICVGAGSLARNDWFEPQAFVPALAGVGGFAAMFVWEALDKRPLVPVRKLLGSIAIVGGVSTIAGSIVYSASQTTMTLELERLHNLTTPQAGLAYAPAAAAAILAGWVYSRLVTTRWVTVVGAVGVVIALVAATAGYLIRPFPIAGIEALLFVAALGAGLSVTPGVFMIALSFERALVARAIALLNMLRLTAGFISVPGVEHSIGSRAADHLRATLPALPSGEAGQAARLFLLQGDVQKDIPRTLLQQAVSAGISYGLLVAIAICLVALAVIAVLFAAKRIHLNAPNVAAIKEGKPALAA